jgi:hypothetical protein
MIRGFFQRAYNFLKDTFNQFFNYADDPNFMDNYENEQQPAEPPNNNSIFFFYY